MADRALVVFESVWKKFRRGERHDSLRDLFPAMFKSVFRGDRREEKLGDQEFWALEDVSFEVTQGEALGIIGPNGAGKSTVLKLLTKILRPSLGHSRVQGRIGALIEVAAGFHPDLTGRENIYLQGAVMGMRASEVSLKLDAIVAFAGVEAFVDTPVKRYSSGMNARLGFSIAAHLEPEVLIIDEVLSVGDMAFQERCVRRMLEFKRQGVTIVFVSHNLQAVTMLCDRALHLDREVRSLGTTESVLQEYLRASDRTPRPATESRIQILGAELRRRDAGDSSVVSPGTALTLRVRYRVNEICSDLTFGFLLHRSADLFVAYDGNYTDRELNADLTPGREFAIDFDFRAHLLRGVYHLDCHVFHNPTQAFLSRLVPAASFGVAETRSYQGLVDIGLAASVVAPVQVGHGEQSVLAL
jgi:lipopolysaccharide transport system ATP-binding protein